MGAFFVCAFWLLSAQAFCPLGEPLPQVRVERAVDGDTLRLADGRSVRLIGINAPETAHHGRPAEPFAEAARRRLQALVAANDGRVGLRLGERRKDRYGRTLAHLFDAQGRNLEAQLLAEGLGYQVAFEADGLVACQRAAEAAARAQRAGLWARARPLAPADLRQSGFALVRGRVERVQRNRGGVWLELQGGLALRIEPSQQARFDLPAVQAMAGRRVEARGWVIDRAKRGGANAKQARWMLTLTHPAMIEVLP